ncbi:MAG: hypothetical protein JWM87_4349 [Candidatus Eremiobacteraeota bacterium]|nr:hypothetical protein [Candidatus Eremiobacteraeota bacterium]
MKAADSGFPNNVTITTKSPSTTASTSSSRLEWVDRTTRQTSSPKYETRVLVWDATIPGSSAVPTDPASILGTKSLTVSTAGAAPKQGA